MFVELIHSQNGMLPETKLLKVLATSDVYKKQKKESFDQAYNRKFCPRHISNFVYSPSFGASGGLVTIWNDHQFDADTVLVNSYSINLKMTSKITNKSFHLTNIYGPAAADEK